MSSYWQASLRGSRVDLEKLHTLIRQPEAEVIREGDRYYLRSTKFAREWTWGEILDAARNLIEIINGQVRIFYTRYRPVSVLSVERVHDSGAREYFDMEGVSIARVTIDGTDTLDSGDPPAGDAEAKVAFTVRLDLAPDQQRAARLFGNVPQDYVNLYRILEIVRGNVGNDNELAKLGWASKTELERFTRTANHPGVIGNAARHGYSKNEPPKNPMPLVEAEELIRRLLNHWTGANPDSHSSASQADSEPVVGGGET